MKDSRRAEFVAVGRSRFFAAAVLLTCLVGSNGTASAAARIERIRSAAGKDYTRIVIDLSRKASFAYATLPADARRGLPPRLYVDLRGVRLDRGRAGAVPIQDARVRRVRTGQFSPTTARVVVDLAVPVAPKVFALETPPRIVVDLTALPARPAAAETAKAAPAFARPRRTAPSAGAAPAVREEAPRKKPAASIPRARKLRVVIDPGHGGKDPGARGPRGLAEKNAAFDIARRLRDKLDHRLGVEVFMTRTDDRFIPLEKRKDIANRLDADLFVSIHANASKNRRLHGIETYYLKNTNDRATLRLAKLENGVDLLMKDEDVSTDADLPYILSDMVQGQKEADSILLAGHVQTGLVEHLRPRYREVESLGVKQGPFLVLDGTYMPAILVEVGFVTNSLEGRRLAASAYRDAVAEGLYEGIKRYLEDDRVGQLR